MSTKKQLLRLVNLINKTGWNNIIHIKGSIKNPKELKNKKNIIQDTYS